MWKKSWGGVGYAHGSSPRGWGRGESEPTRSQPLAIPQLIADEPFLYTAEEQAHMGAACCTVRLTMPDMKKKEEAGGDAGQGMWKAGKEEGDMLDRGCGRRGRRRRLECDLCL